LLPPRLLLFALLPPRLLPFELPPRLLVLLLDPERPLFALLPPRLLPAELLVDPERPLLLPPLLPGRPFELPPEACEVLLLDDPPDGLPFDELPPGRPFEEGLPVLLPCDVLEPPEEWLVAAGLLAGLGADCGFFLSSALPGTEIASKKRAMANKVGKRCEWRCLNFMRPPEAVIKRLQLSTDNHERAMLLNFGPKVFYSCQLRWGPDPTRAPPVLSGDLLFAQPVSAQPALAFGLCH
jgi:hypothetical protein